MSQTAAYLAALASTAVPDLDPVSVRTLHADSATGFDVALVVDTEDRHWTVRVPRTAADAARQDAVVPLLAALAPALPFRVPAPQGFVTVPQGRAMVYPHVDGRPLLLARVPPGPGLAASLGRALATLHDVDSQVFLEAGLVAYDADSCRRHHRAELDRATTSGHVPTPLLGRWERALEDDSLWQFAPVPTHGRFSGRAVLAVFASEDDASTGHVAGMTGWEDAKVADPADDLAALLDECHDETADSALEAYANSRRDRPDPHLRRRAILAAELRRLADLLAAVRADRRDLVRLRSDALRQLQERIQADDRLFPPSGPSPRPRPGPAVPVETAGGNGSEAATPGAATVTQEIPSSALAEALGAQRADPPTEPHAAGRAPVWRHAFDPAPGEGDPWSRGGGSGASADGTGDGGHHP